MSSSRSARLAVLVAVVAAAIGPGLAFAQIPGAPYGGVPADRRPRASIAEADAMGAIRVDFDTSDVDVPITLQSDGTQAHLEVRVDATPFTGPNGVRVEAEVRAGGLPVAWPVDVGGIERRHVVVHAKLPVPGTYVSHLGLVVGTERIADVSLTVQRLRPATHVSVAEIDPVAGTTCGCRGSRPVKLRFAVTETEARPAVVPEPVLSRLVRVERDGSVTQVPDVTARLVPVDGAAWPATLEPASTRVGELELQGLCRAGRHSGTLSFRAGESLPVEKAFTVSIREPAAVALLLLLVGAILGELLRWWVSVGRSRALRAGIVLRQLAALRNLDTAGWTAGSTALVARLEDLLWDLHGRVRSASAAVSEDVLNLLEHKVRVLPLRERAARLEAATGRADLAGALRAIDEVVLDEAATSGRLQEAERDLEQAVGVAGFESRGRLAPATRGDPADILRALHRRIRLADLLVGACVFVVVGMLGLKATWLSDGAWGGIVDHVEALLWGLGLQHFGYTGVTAFRDRLIR